MESVASVMNRLIQQVLEVKGECPHCFEPLFGWKTKNKDGSERCQPTCMKCGYSDLKRKEDRQTQRMYNNSLKTRALNFFENGSIVTDKELFNSRLNNYKELDSETKRAKELAKSFINELMLNKNTHLILNGKTGTGKSHLSMAVCWEVIERSSYNKKCLFINYRELLEQLKFSFNDEEARKAIQGNLIADIKTTDLVVIDDLGSELGGNGLKGATSYNNDVLYSILEARQNMPLIVNTNLTGPEIKQAYGDRILSRILRNSNEHVFTFEQSTDKRIKGVS